jgi:hypothetical protein
MSNVAYLQSIKKTQMFRCSAYREVKSTTQLQAMGRIELILGYELCSLLTALL